MGSKQEKIQQLMEERIQNESEISILAGNLLQNQDISLGFAPSGDVKARIGNTSWTIGESRKIGARINAREKNSVEPIIITSEKEKKSYA